MPRFLIVGAPIRVARVASNGGLESCHGEGKKSTENKKNGNDEGWNMYEKELIDEGWKNIRHVAMKDAREKGRNPKKNLEL